MEFDFKYTYETMPKSNASTSGMKVIDGNLTNIRAEIKSEALIYQTKNGKDLKIRLIYPDFFEKQINYPLVFHIQGSAWFEQNLYSHILDFKEIVTSGYIVAIVEYSPLPEAQFPSQVEDAKMAMRYIKEHADDLRIDTNNIFLSGDSSGGHTALLCWATWENHLLDVSNEKLPPIRGCIDLYGVVDFITINDAESGMDHASSTSPGTLLLGGVVPHENIEIAEKASVQYYLEKNNTVTPLLIMHGNKDKVVPFEQSVQLYECCKEMNLEAEFYCVNNADHGGNAFFCNEVMEVIIGFLKKNTKDS